MANALDIEPIMTLAYDLNSAADWADLVEYLYGDETTDWGAVRVHNDSHPAPFQIKTFELGNEQDNPQFAQQIAAIEAKRKQIPGAPKWNFMYPTNRGPPDAMTVALIASGVEGSRLTPDCHVGAGGGVGCATSSSGWINHNLSGINCETNAATSDLLRGVNEARDLQAWYSQDAATTARLIARTASFCIERAGHFDGFDQGISFFLPNMTWLQPPGHVHSLFSQYAGVDAVTASSSEPHVTASAQLSVDAATLFVQLVNSNDSGATANVTVSLTGFSAAASVDVYTLAEPVPAGTAPNPRAGNPAADPAYIAPVKSSLAWRPSTTLLMPPMSVVVLVAPRA